MVDSEVVKAMIEKETYGFNTFITNRVGEIQQTTSPKEWVWISGKLNIADLITRECKPEEISEDSKWQNGPSFLELPESKWPIRTDTVAMKLPDYKKDGSMGSKAEMRDANEDKMSISEVMGKKTGYSMLGNHVLSTKRSEILKMKEIQEEEKEDSLARRIDIMGIGTYRKLLQVTARVLSLYKKPLSFKNATRDLQNQQVSEAELFWFREAQRSITDYDLKHRYQRLSPLRRSDGIIVVGRRTEKWMNISYNNEMLILLP